MADFTIPKIVLDPQNDEELLQLAYTRIQEASNGIINDFRPGSPVAALVEGQVFAIAELLYYLNKLPEALALEVFRLSGVTRLGGTKSTGYLRFILTGIIGNDFVINPGYTIPYGDSYFVTTEQLVIVAGSTQGDVLVESGRIGADMNVDAFGLVTSPGLNYVQSVFNPERLSGGSDLEPLAATVDRAQQVIRSKDVIITVTDYELAAQDFLGFGSRAIAIPLLGSDRSTKAPGQVHLFCCDSAGQPISLGVTKTLKAHLEPKCFAASYVWVSPIVLDPIEVEIVLGVDEVSETMANEVSQAILDYLSPLSFQWGFKVKINELAYIARQVYGVTEVDSVTINGQPVDHILSTQWTTPFADSLIISLIQPDGINQSFYRGLGTGDVD